MMAENSIAGVPGSQEELAAENASLKRQLQTLYSKHVKQDIISEGELRLTEERDRLLARYDDVKQRCVMAKKKIEHLSVQVSRLGQVAAKYELLRKNSERYEKNDKLLQETLNLNSELETRNRHLASKLEYQERLIQAVAWSGSGNNELLESVEKLNGQKSKLFEGPEADALEIVRSLGDIPTDEQTRRAFNDLLHENDALYSALREEDTRELLADPTPENQRVVFDLDNLNSESRNAGVLLDAHADVLATINSDNPEEKERRVLLALQNENRLLKNTLEEKKEKIKHLVNNPEKDALVRKNLDLKRTVIRMRHTIESMNHKVDILTTKCKHLEAVAEKSKHLFRENLFLKRESEKLTLLLERHKKLFDMCNDQKKTIVNLTMRYEFLNNECKDLKARKTTLESQISAMRAEYGNLINEYNMLFNEE